MDLLQTSISQYLANVNHDNTKALEIATKLASQIENKHLKLLDLVKSLGDYLTADDDLLRPKATMCLSQTLDQISPSGLTKHDIQVLISFYLSKIDDLKSTKETLFGIDSLIVMNQFPPIHIKPILTILQDQYQSTQHLASTRFFTFDILNNLFDKFPHVVQKYSNQFIETFIHIASGEKDPKNLLISFTLNGKISSTLQIDNYKDDLFDVLFCYFPISFKPPKDDPYKITSDDLKNALRQAIASNSLFAEDSYPNLLEKLTSTAPIVKHDTIKTITQCIKNYSIDSLIANYIELWNALKFEILHGDPDDDEDELFPPILEIFTTITQKLESNQEYFEKFINLVLDELKSNIQTLTNKQKQSCILLSSISSASPQAFNKIIYPTITLLLNNSTLSTQDQRSLITNLGYFTSSYILVFGTITEEKNVSQISENSLLQFKDEILILLGKALMSTSKIEVALRTLSIAELTKLTTLLDFLSPEEISLIVQYFTETVLIDDNEYVYGAGISGLIQIGSIDSSILLEITFPKLLDFLPIDGSMIEILIDDEFKPRIKIFEVLKSITRDKQLGDWVLEKLIKKLSELNELDNVYGFEISETCLVILKEIQRLSPFDTDLYLKTLYPQLLDILDKNHSNDEFLESIGDLIKLIIVYSKKNLHQEILDDSINKFIYEKGLITGSPNKLINIFVKIIAGLDKIVIFPKVDEFLDDLIKFTELNSNELNKEPYTKLGYLQLISLIMNKFISNDSKYINYLDNSDGISSINLEIFTWITKSIVLKMSSESENYITILFNYLSNEEFGLIITKSFEILVIDLNNFEKFKKKQNNNVRLLYKQSFFQIITPLLISGFQQTQDLKTKSNYLTSLSYILKHIKREIIIPHLSSFFPLLLQAISLPKSEVRYASINTILSTIDEIPDLVSSHLSTLIPKFLEMSQHKNTRLNNEKVRLICLQVLEALVHTVDITKLIPFQERIIKELSDVLDDPKRSVRKAAIDTRQAYYELGRTVD
ncbi:MMS19 nucleotide excision repair protein [Wickerhamomyces ciferrii]|uniref:MMS19 nucleotide excision repair protein n=1 Tax=Wickerhamomyces ciferrii (strain ATCC 14091 / BCRC 22168 / CBS 111 / JCM 3599 / NBRC 0793 / NRRL Y-1031 F-60-10) TaxID=1206466 RepID=K0KK01_WICCF|nr:MMS19 nucleotide excision repair protein [Wickerhamomyces ciferrii]CCH42497.1 MMS19 nucleotide excision repair protein [Wickerhamomyces ciferrii]